MSRRSLLIYGLLLAAWALVVGWQMQEHVRVQESAKTDLRNRSREIASTVSAFIRGLQFRGAVLQERMEPVLNELVSGRTNDLVKSSELISIVLLNVDGKTLASAGKPLDLEQKGLMQEGERWGRRTLTLVNPVEGASLTPEGATNPTVVLPPRSEFTNTMRDGGRGFPRREPPPDDLEPQNAVRGSATTNATNRTEADGRPRGPRRPPWLRGMDEKEYQALIAKRALHGLVLVMSTDAFQSAARRDFWLRSIIVVLATVSVLGSGLAWRNLAKSSELQIRLVRASELNAHLKEMNLAAAGLAHETRNPLNILRGLAQMISKQQDAAPEIRKKSQEIIEEADRVTAQLNEFINYSRPREVRPSKLALSSVAGEVVRTLQCDIEDKNIRLRITEEPITIEADEQLFRQALFNLLLNAIQAVGRGGEIEVFAARGKSADALLEVRDNGPGVPPDRRKDIFKPYVTTHQQGTGLGLAVVQQIVLAHGWEIECLPNEPKGAVFRLSHLRIAA